MPGRPEVVNGRRVQRSIVCAHRTQQVVAIHRQWCGRAIDLEGKRLKEVASRLQRESTVHAEP